MVDIRSATAEITRGKQRYRKKKKKIEVTTGQTHGKNLLYLCFVLLLLLLLLFVDEYNGMPYAIGRP